MITDMPTDAENMSLFELITTIGSDRAIEMEDMCNKSPQLKQICKSINNIVDLLTIDKSSKEKKYDEAMCLLGNSWEKTYQLGFADGIRFIMQAMNA